MVIDLKHFFKQAAIAGSIGMAATGVQANTPTDAPNILSSAQAKTIITTSNNAAVDLIAAGIVNMFNPTGKLILESGNSVDIGLGKDSCEKVIKAKKDIGSPETYAMAQKVLTDAGHTTDAQSKKDLATHLNLTKIIEGQMPGLIKTCAYFGIPMETKP